jgi:hypothetical protein
MKEYFGCDAHKQYASVSEVTPGRICPAYGGSAEGMTFGMTISYCRFETATVVPMTIGTASQ